METAGLIIRMVGALVMIMGLLLISLYGIRRWGKRLRGTEGDLIQILATKMILPKKHICLVRVGNNTLILGVSEQCISSLGTIHQDQLAHSALHGDEAGK